VCVCLAAAVEDKGAEGLPGPFKQALSDISSEITKFAWQAGVAKGSGPKVDDKGGVKTDTPGTYSLFIPCPNSLNETGESRNKLIIDPCRTTTEDLQRCYAFGLLIGVAIRSKQCLSLDLAEIFWKILLDTEPLTGTDLIGFDYTAWNNLQFRNTM